MGHSPMPFAEQAEGVLRVRERDLGARDVGEGGDAVVAERGTNHAPLLVEHHPFVQRPAEPLRNRAFDLGA